MTPDPASPAEPEPFETQASETANSEAPEPPGILEVVDEAAEGEVQWYGLAKGYGFLRVPGRDDDVFVHHSQLVDPDNLLAGDRVRFRLVRTRRGFQAQELRVVAEADSVDPAS